MPGTWRRRLPPDRRGRPVGARRRLRSALPGSRRTWFGKEGWESRKSASRACSRGVERSLACQDRTQVWPAGCSCSSDEKGPGRQDERVSGTYSLFLPRSDRAAVPEGKYGARVARQAGSARWSAPLTTEGGLHRSSQTVLHRYDQERGSSVVAAHHGGSHRSRCDVRQANSSAPAHAPIPLLDSVSWSALSPDRLRLVR